ncbi:MAG: histidine phosphatase family protein [Gammaproteobacteria bacterium]|nr:histidine phosphatase family protein [Gammaproteobacteria bacterium]
MSRTVFAFLRHGDYFQLEKTPSAWQPFSLNQEGIKQAKTAAAKITDFCQKNKLEINTICDSSQMLRAWQTADIIVQDLNTENTSLNSINIQTYDQLAERGVGSVANLSTAKIEQIINDDPRYSTLPENWKSDSYFKLPFQGAESLMDAGLRVAEHIKISYQQLLDSTIQGKQGKQNKQDTLKLIVGHGASFRHAAYHLGMLKFEDIKKYSMYHADPIYFEQIENHTWQHIAGDWKIRKPKSEYKD